MPRINIISTDSKTVIEQEICFGISLDIHVLGHLSLREFPVYILLFYMLKIKFLSIFWLLDCKMQRAKSMQSSEGREGAFKSPADFCMKLETLSAVATV